MKHRTLTSKESQVMAGLTTSNKDNLIYEENCDNDSLSARMERRRTRGIDDMSIYNDSIMADEPRNTGV